MKAYAIAIVVAVAIPASLSVGTKAQGRQGRGAAPVSPYPVVAGKAYQFEKVADGIYYATSTGSMVTGSNNVVIIGDREVMVVDTGTSPAAARAMVEDLKAVTTNPVRF